MKKTTTVLVLAIGVTIGISVAPLAGADPSFCQQVGSTTVCGQGGVNSVGQSARHPGAWSPTACTNQFGGYQNCNPR